MLRRSSEELRIRDAVERWGRQRWPAARVVHELVVSDCRIDMAFICPDDLIGVEIKSGRDTLDRLKKQLRVFRQHIPEVWVAYSPAWEEKLGYLGHGAFYVDHTGVRREHFTRRGYVIPMRSIRSWRCYTNMLELLWAQEARNIAARHGLPKPKRPRYKLLPELALRLSGEKIMSEVCRELRARRAFWRADPPVCIPQEKSHA